LPTLPNPVIDLEFTPYALDIKFDDIEEEKETEGSQGWRFPRESGRRCWKYQCKSHFELHTKAE
jgi:hypothetical protein